MKHLTTLLVTGAMAGVLPAAAFSQTTGVSHPDETVVVTTAADGLQQPVYTGPGPITVAPASTGTVPLGYVSTPTLHEPTLRQPALHDPALHEGGERRSALQTAASVPADVDAGIVTSLPGEGNEITEGTLLRMRLREALSTEHTRAGSEFTAELTEPVERDGRVLLPVGTLVTGQVTEVSSGRRMSGGAALHIVPTAVTLPDGVRYALQAQVVDTNRYRNIKVDSEGTMLRRGHPKETLAVLGLAAGGGAAAGGLLAGPGGALVGGAIGAGVGTVVWLKEDRQEEIPAGTELVLSVNASLAVGAK